MSAVGDARKRLAETVVTPRVEALAAVLWQAEYDASASKQGFGATYREDPCAFSYRAQARAVLASEWLADLLAEARAEERERVAQAIEARGRVCSDAHGMECIGGVAYRDAAHIAREVPRA